MILERHPTQLTKSVDPKDGDDDAIMVDHTPATDGPKGDHINISPSEHDRIMRMKKMLALAIKSGRTALTVEGEDEKGIVRLQRKR